MKARIITAIMLMSTLTTFAQTSRRETSESRTSNDNTKRTSTPVRQENPRSESTTTSQRTYPGSSTSERRSSTDQRNYDSRERKSVPAPEHSQIRRGDSRSVEHSKKVVVYNRNDRHPRKSVTVVHHHRPAPVQHVHHTYRAPSRPQIYWSISMSRDYRVYYPEVRYWRYSPGYRIASIPAYDAIDYTGEVANVYGKVREVYYEPGTDEFFLYFGDYYPYHDFSIIISGRDARYLSRNPARYFEGQHVNVTGYIQSFEGKPEITIRSLRQLDVY